MILIILFIDLDLQYFKYKEINTYVTLISKTVWFQSVLKSEYCTIYTHFLCFYLFGKYLVIFKAVSVVSNFIDCKDIKFLST